MTKTTMIITEHPENLERRAKFYPDSLRIERLKDGKLVTLRVIAYDNRGIAVTERFLGHQADWKEKKGSS